MNATMHKRKAIVLDCDDCVFDFLGYLIHLHNRKYNTHMTRSQVTSWNLDTEEVQDIFGQLVKDATLEKTFKELEPHGLYAVLPVFYESKQAIKIAKDLNYAVIFLTARDEQYQIQTELNVYNNDIIPDKLIFSKDKVKIINELSTKYDVIVFADDNHVNVKAVNANCKVKYPILVNRPHNQNAKLSQKITRVNDLLETIRFLIHQPEVKKEEE